MSVFLWKRRLCVEITRVYGRDGQHGFNWAASYGHHFEAVQIPTQPIGSACCKPRNSRFRGVIVFCFVAGDRARSASVSPTDQPSFCQSAIDASRPFTSLCSCALIMEHCVKCVPICSDTRKLCGSNLELHVACTFPLNSCESGTETQPLGKAVSHEVRLPVSETFWVAGWDILSRRLRSRAAGWDLEPPSETTWAAGWDILSRRVGHLEPPGEIWSRRARHIEPPGETSWVAGGDLEPLLETEWNSKIVFKELFVHTVALLRLTFI
jgi:hypothetical protein